MNNQELKRLLTQRDKQEKRMLKQRIKQNTKNHIYFLKKIGSIYAYLFILFLFFKNNLRFIINPNFRKNFHTWKLINKSYFEGIIM